jgi:hypothetical protein
MDNGRREIRGDCPEEKLTFAGLVATDLRSSAVAMT